jgi:steroid delta-isomerase-like uncharacterized protein
VQRVQKRQVRLLWCPTVLTGSIGIRSKRAWQPATREVTLCFSFRRVYPCTLLGGPFDSGASREGLREPSAHVTRNHAMNPIEVVRRYNQAWNGRDANAIVQLFAEGGTYSNPHAGQCLTGEAIGNYAKAVWAALPDMTAELVSVREIAPGQVAHEWLLRGTNTGPLMDGSPATERSVIIPGNDVIAVEGGKIRSVEVSYDRQAADAQLGATTT